MINFSWEETLLKIIRLVFIYCVLNLSVFCVSTALADFCFIFNLFMLKMGQLDVVTVKSLKHSKFVFFILRDTIPSIMNCGFDSMAFDILTLPCYSCLKLTFITVSN